MSKIRIVLARHAWIASIDKVAITTHHHHEVVVDTDNKENSYSSLS
jgi:hypothetical protein